MKMPLSPCVVTLVFAGLILLAAAGCQDAPPQLGKASLDEVIAAMTLDEKVTLLVGVGMAGADDGSAVVGQTAMLVPGAAGATQAIPRLGIPSIVLADGPAGLRIAPTRAGDSHTYYCTAFPVATLLASTWNPAMAGMVGSAMGNEALEYGVDVLLGPALNIQRNALCGRNFEYYSEDPLLSGKIAAAMTRGIQRDGVGVSLKHFAANNQETNRQGNDSRISERALREIYLKGFEIAVREAEPRTIMSSYNKINGVYTSESRKLLTDILRTEWGFDGLVMTDWFGGSNPPAQIHAGNDLLMPGQARQKAAIMEAVNKGELAADDVNESVKRVLRLILASPRFAGYKFSNAPDLKANAHIARQAAAEGMVLLKNERATLPLPATTKKVAAFGLTSYDFISGGTGSGDVNEAYTVSLGEGLTDAGYRLDGALQTWYDEYLRQEKEKGKAADAKNPVAAFMPKARPVEPLPDAATLRRVASQTDVALITLGRTSGEFRDRTLAGDYELTEAEKQLVRAVVSAFHAQGKKAVVVLNIGGVIETASWKNLPDAILLAWQPGQEGGNVVADVLSGKVNPSGRLPMTFPVRYMDDVTSANFPYDYQPAPGANPLAAREAGAEPVRNVDYTDYAEGVFVGYRYFTSQNKAVSYPFGFGLSYTTFKYEAARLSEVGGGYAVTVKITNTGKVRGKEVVQLYVSAPADKPRPVRELQAFAKTRELNPGASEVVTMTIPDSALAYYDEASRKWVTTAGEYKFILGANAGDSKTTLTASRAGS